MKKIIISLAIAGVGLSSCNDFLETYSPSQYDTKSVYNNVANTEMALMGVYSLMTDDNMYSSRLSLMFPYNSDIEVAGADASSYSEDGSRGLSNYMGTPSFSKASLDKVWRTIYKGIERANNIIVNVPGSEVFNSGTSEEKSKMNRLYGEALALRSLYYFELIRNWGDVPLKLDVTQYDGSNFYIPATNRDLIYDQILADLKTASDLIPWVGLNGYTSERVTKGFVKGLRARVALAAGGYSLRNEPGYPYRRNDNYQDYYRIAKQECEEILTDGKNPHKLNLTYENIFKNLCQWKLDDAYNENLFEVAMGYGRSGEMGYSIGVRFEATPKYGFGNNANVVSTSPYYFYMFDKGDKRREATIAYYRVTNTNGSAKETFQSNPYVWCIAKYDMRKMNSTFLAGNLSANAKVGYGINYVLMRYSDVKMMYAEACNELQIDLDKARIQFMEVRSRGFNDGDPDLVVDLSTQDAFFRAIVRERALEFGGEGIRKYDLVRWGLISTKIQEQRDTYNAMLVGGDIVLPNGKTATLPSKLLPVYDVENAEVLDKKATNLYAATSSDATAVSFLSGWADDPVTGGTKKNAREQIERFSSGLNNSSVKNRHLFPIPTIVIAESGGLLKNAYGW